MELEEAKKILKLIMWQLEKPPQNTSSTTHNDEINAIKFVLNHLTKQEKMIKAMSKEITERLGSCPFDTYEYEMNSCEDCNDTYEECWEQYFEKKVEESE